MNGAEDGDYFSFLQVFSTEHLQHFFVINRCILLRILLHDFFYYITRLKLPFLCCLSEQLTQMVILVKVLVFLCTSDIVIYTHKPQSTQSPHKPTMSHCSFSFKFHSFTPTFIPTLTSIFQVRNNFCI